MKAGRRQSDAACPACGASVSLWREVPGGEPADTRRYELLRCAACGSALTRAPVPPGAYETGMYAADAPRAAGAIRGLMRAALRQVVRLLRRAGVEPGSRVLDAGAGAGLLVEVLRDAGYDAYGIEPSRRGLERAAEAGRPVIAHAVEEHDASGLDAVVLWHVLEHVHEPAEALARVAGWLRPGGVLLVGVPNLGSLQARIGGELWFHLDVPRHRTHFTVRGLRELLERAGFEPVRERHLVVEHNVSAMWFALLSRLGMTPGFPFHVLKRSVRARPLDVALLLLAGPLLLLPALVLEAVAAAARRGGTVAVAVRRRG